MAYEEPFYASRTADGEENYVATSINFSGGKLTLKHDDIVSDGSRPGTSRYVTLQADGTANLSVMSYAPAADNPATSVGGQPMVNEVALSETFQAQMRAVLDDAKARTESGAGRLLSEAQASRIESLVTSIVQTYGVETAPRKPPEARTR